MNSQKVVVGIDTSNYTTSFSVLSLDGELIANFKRPLAVKMGERGLRQSDAVFSHIKNFPLLMQDVKELLKDMTVVAVGVSDKPRNVDGSYMPCFLTGVAVAEGIAATCGIPLYRFSHQCGHIMAAIYSSGKTMFLDGRAFCAFHVSGGTTEMLRVKYCDNAFFAELVGGTHDLNAGQIIDRIGVYMGLSFPAGAEMERLAICNNKKLPSSKPKISMGKINLSGLENIAVKLYEQTEDKSFVSAFVFDYVSKALSLLADNYVSLYGDADFLFAGGVMSNSIIKSVLAKKYRAAFALPAFSSDNAVGIAELARLKFRS